MSEELQDRMIALSQGAQGTLNQGSLIFSGMVKGNTEEPTIAQAITDALEIAKTTNDAGQWINGLLAEAALNGMFTTGGPPGSDEVTQAELDAEIALRTSGDVTLGAAIGAEAAARGSQDASLSFSLTNESNSRSSADAALDARLDVLEGNPPRVVRTEAELRAAMILGGDILIPGIDLPVDAPISPPVPGTRLRGLGKGNSRLIASSTFSGGMVVFPSVEDLTFRDLTISGGVHRVVGVGMGGFRGANRCTFDNVWIRSVSDGVQLSGAATVNPAYIVKDFSFLNSTVTDFDHAGINLNWEMLRPVLDNFYVWGNGASSVHNGVWIGNGVHGGRFTNGLVGNVNRNGVEFFHMYEPAALTSTGESFGPTLTASNITTIDTGGIGVSFSDCRRSRISNITALRAHSIGVEFVDEVAGISNWTADGINVFDSYGTGISIDKIRGGRFSHMFVDTISVILGKQQGIHFQTTDNVVLESSTITKAGPRYILAVGSTRTEIVRNEFVATPGENFSAAPEGGNFAVYFAGGSAYFNGNTIRGNATNPLHTAFNGASIVTNPTAAPLVGPGIPTYNPNFVDPDNYRP